jgi:flagellar assembly factor FliW
LRVRNPPSERRVAGEAPFYAGSDAPQSQSTTGFQTNYLRHRPDFGHTQGMAPDHFDLPTTFVDSPETLAEALPHWFAANLLAVDIECSLTGFHHCVLALLQVATHDQAWLVDPLAIPELMRPALLAMAEVPWIVHDFSGDGIVFKRIYDVVPSSVMDTMLLARTLGYPQPGLKTMARLKLGLEIPKEEQDSNWMHRPLREAQISYAARDAALLLPLLRTLALEAEAKRDDPEVGPRLAQLPGEMRRLLHPGAPYRPPPDHEPGGGQDPPPGAGRGRHGQGPAAHGAAPPLGQPGRRGRGHGTGQPLDHRPAGASAQDQGSPGALHPNPRFRRTRLEALWEVLGELTSSIVRPHKAHAPGAHGPGRFIIRFPEGLIGFPEHTAFTLLEAQDGYPLKFLQSVADPGVSFTCMDAVCAKLDYEVPLPPADAEALALEAPEDALVLVIVVGAGQRPRQTTANLAGPLVINLRTRTGRQVALDSSKVYPLKYKVFTLPRRRPSSVPGGAHRLPGYKAFRLFEPRRLPAQVPAVGRPGGHLLHLHRRGGDQAGLRGAHERRRRPGPGHRGAGGRADPRPGVDPRGPFPDDRQSGRPAGRERKDLAGATDRAQHRQISARLPVFPGK